MANRIPDPHWVRDQTWNTVKDVPEYLWGRVFTPHQKTYFQHDPTWRRTVDGGRIVLCKPGQHEGYEYWILWFYSQAWDPNYKYAIVWKPVFNEGDDQDPPEDDPPSAEDLVGKAGKSDTGSLKPVSV